MFNEIIGDKAVLSGLLTKLIQGITGPITAVLVLHFFSPDVQGYYYTFGSLMALQIFVELGLSAVVTTFAAHEWAALSLDSTGKIVGDQQAQRRLAGMARSVFRWYLTGAGILFIVLLTVGSWFFGANPQSGHVQWLGPWIAMCCLASVNFAMTPSWALLIGCGQIRSVNGYRLVETILRSGVIWIAISLGVGLWATVISIGIAVGVGTFFLAVRYRRFFANLLRIPPVQDWSWRKEIFPLQAKVAISWLSGYFAFSLFTPAAFHFLGPSAAGQMGMTWTFVAGLSGLAATWLQVRSPNFAVLVAQRNFQALDVLAKSTVKVGTMVCSIGGAAGVLAIAILDNYRPDLAARFLPLGAIAIFMMTEAIHQISMVQSSYLRAFKQEPFLWVSLSSGIIIGLGTLLLTKSFGGYGSALSYLGGISVALVWGTIIFYRCRRQWTS